MAKTPEEIAQIVISHVQFERFFGSEKQILEIEIAAAIRAERARAEAEHEKAVRVVEALDQILDCQRYMRSGGATSQDLESYETGMNEVMEIAAAARTQWDADHEA